MRKLLMAVLAAFLASPVAAATVGTFTPGSIFSPDSVGTLSDSGRQWNFGVPVSGHTYESYYRSKFPGMDGGRSTVRLTGSGACDNVTAGAECLVGTITYTNRVNVGSGPGPDRATAAFSGTQYNFNVAFNILVDRSTNQQPGSGCQQNFFGCADQWTVAFTTPMDGFRIEGSGGFVHEEASGDIRIFWTRPSVPPSVVPLPASVWLLGAGVAGLAALRRRRRG